ncbi:MAG TPA: tetratricopeptide repeat protein [Bryobacteraceae bacterium]
MNPEPAKNSSTYRFAQFTLDIERACLYKTGREVKLRPKVYDALQYFVENRGRLIGKDELIQTLWAETFVTDDSLVQCMVELRRALDDRSQDILKTVPRRGYIFAAEVTEEAEAAPAEAQIGKPPAQGIAGAYHLPAPRTSLIGRERELAGIEALLLNPAIRLITLTGSGGSGKTRLALEVAGKVVQRFSGQVYFVGLGSLSDPAMVPAAIAQAIGIRETGGRPFIETVKSHLREFAPSPVLLLLDNLEHLLPASPVIIELIEATRGVKILATSRAALRVYGEHEFPVPPLDVPDEKQVEAMDGLINNPAVALFAQRAAAVKPDFKLTVENAPVVAEICARVDGLPLAIELAAAMVKMLPPSRILTRLQSPLELLTAGARDLPERQQTLRNTIHWSYALLNEAEKKLFRRLGVFWGGCTLEAAEAVCNTRSDLGAGTFQLMASLLDKSLIEQMQHCEEEARFRLLETIREYSRERLRESGEEEATQRAHAAYCLVLAEEGNPELSEPERAAWLARCDIEHDDFRAALDWLFQARNMDWAFRLCVALSRFWDMREHLSEGRSRLETVLRLAGSDYPKQRAKALLFLGAFATTQGDFPAATSFLERGLSACQEAGDEVGVAVSFNALAVSQRVSGDYLAAQNNFERTLECWRRLDDSVATARCLHNLANVAKIRGDYARAREALWEAMHIFESVGDREGAAWSLNQQGDLAREQGHAAEARQLYERALSAFREAGDRWGSARSLADIGSIACDQGDFAAASAAYGQSLELFSGVGHRRGVARVLEGLACLALARGDAKRSLALAAAAAHLRQLIGAPLNPAEQSDLDQKLALARSSLDEFEARNAWNKGWSMTVEAAIQHSRENPQGATSGYSGQ